MSLSRSRPQSPSRLSGTWVGFQEAIAWVQARDASVAKMMRSDDPIEAAVDLVLSGADVLATCAEAEAILLDALRHGDIVALGRRGAPVERDEPLNLEIIPDAEWSRLRFRWHLGHFVAMSEPGAASVQVWHELRFQAASLVEWVPPAVDASPNDSRPAQIAPPAVPEPTAPKASPAALRKRAGAAMKAIVKRWRDDGADPRRRPSIDEAVAELRIEIEGLSITEGRRAWKEHAPAEWKKKGPRGPRTSAGVAPFAKSDEPSD